MSVPETIATILISALVSGLLATCVSFYLNRQHTKNLLKRDVLRRLVGNRFVLTNPGVGSKGEPFIALNETFVIYADHPEVIYALRKMHENLALPDRLPVNLLNLVKAMAKAAKVPVHQLNDDFFLRPFTPPS
jgi:hypothetical protein